MTILGRLYSPAHRTSGHVTPLTLTIRLLVSLLDSILVDVGVARVHPADMGESGGEEGGVLVAVSRVGVCSLDGGIAVDCRSVTEGNV